MSTTSFKSTFSIPYPPYTPLNTLDIHIPTSTPLHPRPLSLIYIHGGAFRDPYQTSTSLLPSLCALSALRPLSAIASINYRLSPYPTHPALPSTPDDDGGRNAVWPMHAQDVAGAVRWLRDRPPGGRGGGGGGGGGEGEKVGFFGWGRDVLLVGHSVGATLAVEVAGMLRGDGEWDGEEGRGRVSGVVGLAGIYDFGALRDAHLGMAEVYEGFIAGALGREEEGKWERARVGRDKVRRGLTGGGVLVLGRSRGDELVEWGQVDGLLGELGEEESGGEGVLVRVVECEGAHDEIVRRGEEIARCVAIALDMLMGDGDGAR